jgi:hypothetical protein
MQIVLFKTSEPTAAEGPVEFYSISITLQDFEGIQASVVQETHGWWSNETGKATFDHDFRVPPEAFVSFGDGVDRYCSLRVQRARAGFSHSFSWPLFVGPPTNYKRIEIPVGPQFQPTNDSAS